MKLAMNEFYLDNEHCPDSWVVVKMDSGYKILAGWSGGYTTGDSWRINSGITEVEKDGDYYLFHGFSGSVYRCHKDGYSIRLSTAGIWKQLSETGKCTLMPENTNWMELKNERTN